MGGIGFGSGAGIGEGGRGFGEGPGIGAGGMGSGRCDFRIGDAHEKWTVSNPVRKHAVVHLIKSRRVFICLPRDIQNGRSGAALKQASNVPNHVSPVGQCIVGNMLILPGPCN